MSNRPGPERDVYVAWQVKHGHRPDGWWFVVEIPGQLFVRDLAQRHPTGPGCEPAHRWRARPHGRRAHPASVRPIQMQR